MAFARGWRRGNWRAVARIEFTVSSGLTQGQWRKYLKLWKQVLYIFFRKHKSACSFYCFVQLLQWGRIAIPSADSGSAPEKYVLLLSLRESGSWIKDEMMLNQERASSVIEQKHGCVRRGEVTPLHAPAERKALGWGS